MNAVLWNRSFASPSYVTYRGVTQYAKCCLSGPYCVCTFIGFFGSPMLYLIYWNKKSIMENTAEARSFLLSMVECMYCQWVYVLYHVKELGRLFVLYFSNFVLELWPQKYYQYCLNRLSCTDFSFRCLK